MSTQLDLVAWLVAQSPGAEFTVDVRDSEGLIVRHTDLVAGDVAGIDHRLPRRAFAFAQEKRGGVLMLRVRTRAGSAGRVVIDVDRGRSPEK